MTLLPIPEGVPVTGDYCNIAYLEALGTTSARLWQYRRGLERLCIWDVPVPINSPWLPPEVTRGVHQLAPYPALDIIDLHDGPILGLS